MRPLWLLAVFIPFTVGAQAPAARDVKDLSLEDLLDQPIEVTTRKARKARQAPGVVLVLTREEILATGARDLLEVLQLVPGFSFHVATTPRRKSNGISRNSKAAPASWK